MAVERFANPFPQFFLTGLKLLPGGLLEFFEPGSTTQQKATFKEQSLTTANENPYVLDDQGVISTDIWLNGTYRVTLSNSDGVQLYEADIIGGGTTGAAFDDWDATVSYAINFLVTGSDGCRYQSLTADNLNNDPANEASPTNWEKIPLIGEWNPNIPYSINDQVRRSDGNLYRSATNTNLNNDPLTDGVNWKIAVRDQSHIAYFFGTG